MTKPMYEPSDANIQGNQGYRIRQLERRPGPAGTLIQYFRAARYLTDVVRTSGGSQTVVLWDWWEYCDDTVFTPLDQALQPDPTPGVDQVQRVQLDADGRYTFYFGAVADVSANGPIELAMHDGDTPWGFSDSALHYDHTSFGGSFLVLSLSRVYPMGDPFGSGSFVPQISFTVSQVTGANVNFNPLIMEIQYEPNVDMCAIGSS